MAPRALGIEQRQFVGAPVPAVFEAISTPDGLCRWILQKAEISPKKGSPYRFEWNGGYAHEGTVMAFQPGAS
jgi:uncharacterized protein YndB with AHSA1/START domain